MRRLRRYALAALALDLAAGLCALAMLQSGSDAAAVPLAYRFVEAPGGDCVALISTERGVWRYEGPAEAEACTEGAPTRPLEQVASANG